MEILLNSHYQSSLSLSNDDAFQAFLEYVLVSAFC